MRCEQCHSMQGLRLEGGVGAVPACRCGQINYILHINNRKALFFLHLSHSRALWGCPGAGGLIKRVNILRVGGCLGFNMLAHCTKRKHLEQMAGMVGRDDGNSSISHSTA